MSFCLIIKYACCQEPISRREKLPCSGVMAFSRIDLFLVHSSHTHQYLIVDITGSLYNHQSETIMADSNEFELSDSYGNLSVVSDENFEVSGSSEESVREDELEIEHGSAVSCPVRCIILPRTRTSLEISRE